MKVANCGFAANLVVFEDILASQNILLGRQWEHGSVRCEYVRFLRALGPYLVWDTFEVDLAYAIPTANESFEATQRAAAVVTEYLFVGRRSGVTWVIAPISHCLWTMSFTTFKCSFWHNSGFIIKIVCIR